MEKQLSNNLHCETDEKESFCPKSPEKIKKKYVSPVLSEVTFATEEGFANSLAVPDTSIESYTLDSENTSSWL